MNKIDKELSELIHLSNYTKLDKKEEAYLIKELSEYIEPLIPKTIYTFHENISPQEIKKKLCSIDDCFKELPIESIVKTLGSMENVSVYDIDKYSIYDESEARNHYTVTKSRNNELNI